MVKRPTLDFAYRTNRWQVNEYNRQGQLLLASIALAGVLFLTAIWKIYTLRTDSTLLDTAIQQTQMAVAAKVPASIPNARAITQEHVQAVNAAIRQLNLPWRDILNALEQATPGHIALLTIEPDSTRNLIRATAEAKTADAMLGYLDRLNRSPFFVAASLTHHEINDQDAQKPFRFTIEAFLRDPVLESRP